VGRKINRNFEYVMQINVSRIKDFLLLVLLFVLPWQTRLIYQTAYLGENFWEFGSLSLYGVEILLGVTVLFFLVDKIRSDFHSLLIKHFNKKRLAIILASIFGIFLLYLLTSAHCAITWQYLNWFIYGLCLIFITLESQLSLKKLLLAVWAGGFLQGVLAIWQFFNQYIPANKWLGMAVQDPRQLGVAVVEFGDERWLRAYGSFGWPNSLGIYLAVVFLLGIILIEIENIKKYRIMLLVGQLFIIIGLFFSFARGAWLAGVVGLCIFGIKKYKDRIFWQQIGVYAVTTLMLLIIFKPLVISRFDLQNRLEKNSISQRIDQGVEFKKIFYSNYLVGTGPGNYTAVLHNLFPQYFAYDLKPVHNIYLLFVAEFGLFGLFLLVIFLFRNIKLVYLYFAPLVALLVAGLFDHWSMSTFTGLTFLCLMIGLSVKYFAIDTKVSPE